MSDSVTLKHTGYRVTGTAYLTLWGGDKATIEMEPYEVKSLDEDEIAEGINDNGFGVQSIDGADCWIEKVYGHGYRVGIGQMEFRDGKCVRKDIDE